MWKKIKDTNLEYNKGGAVLVFMQKILKIEVSLDFVRKNILDFLSSVDANNLKSYNMTGCLNKQDNNLCR